MAKKQISFPRYQQIAVEIAERIVSGKYPVGSKLQARSTLASNFSVSSETARKAINVLVDLEIMEVRHGSGAFVASPAKAKEFLANYQDVASLQDMKKELFQSIETQKREFDHLTSLMDRFLNRTKHIQQQLPFVPMELTLSEPSENYGKSISELNIWHSTGATIVAISHEDQLLVSPGPYTKVERHDTLYFVGDELSESRMRNLFS